MQSRGDQVRSYQFFLQRVISGLVARESDPAELPFRRLGGAALGSVMVTVLLLAGFGIFGLVVGGGAATWRDGRSIIQEKESGARFVYRAERLHPVANLASARLVLGGNAPVTRVSARSLTGVPRGATIGIPGAPDSLPAAERLLTAGWTFCSQRVDDGRGGREVIGTLAVGSPAVGDEVSGAEPPAMLVRDASGGERFHLVWTGHRFPIEAAGTAATVEPVLRALGIGPETAIPVAVAWLDSLPAGDPLRVPSVPDPGGPTTALGDQRQDQPVRQGQVVTAAGTSYLVRAETLLPITPLQRDIVLNAPATVAAYPDQAPHARELSLATAQVAAAPDRTPTSPPQVQPRFANLAAEDLRDGAVCAEFAPGEFIPTVRTGGRPAAGAVDTPRRTGQGGVLADRVIVDGGSAILARALPAPGAPGGSLHLVTDQGVRYPLADQAVAGMLGYGLDRVVGIPSSLLDRIPAGPTLDPVAATRPVDTAGAR